MVGMVVGGALEAGVADPSHWAWVAEEVLDQEVEVVEVTGGIGAIKRSLICPRSCPGSQCQRVVEAQMQPVMFVARLAILQGSAQRKSVLLMCAMHGKGRCRLGFFLGGGL